MRCESWGRSSECAPPLHADTPTPAIHPAQRQDPETRQSLFQHIFSHLSLVFEPDRSRTHPTAAPAQGVAQTAAGQLGAIARFGAGVFSSDEVPSHEQLCHTALSLYEHVLHVKRKVLDARSWSHLLRILLGVADRLLVPAQGERTNSLGDKLQLELVHLAVGAWNGSPAV